MANREAFDSVYGNQAVKTAICGFADRNAFPSSLIISGKRGTGKYTFARLLAMSAVCTEKNKPCLKCEACRKISEGISPDVITVSSDGDRKTVGIELVRAIRETAYVVPNDLDAKFYIIKDADTMTEQAQNALLKLFEEPPKRVYFILLCTNSGGLLTTVRSRAPELRTESFGNEKLKSLLLSEVRGARELAESDPAAFERLIHMSDGSYGEAKQLLADNDKKLFWGFTATAELIELLSDGTRGEFMTAVFSRASVKGKPNREKLSTVFSHMLTAVRDMAAVKKCTGRLELLFFRDAEEAKRAAAPFVLKALLDISDTLTEAKLALSDTNVNAATAASVFSERIWRSK